MVWYGTNNQYANSQTLDTFQFWADDVYPNVYTTLVTVE